MAPYFQIKLELGGSRKQFNGRHDIQHGGIQHKNKRNATLSIMALNAECCYADCRKQAQYAECHYDECALCRLDNVIQLPA